MRPSIHYIGLTVPADRLDAISPEHHSAGACPLTSRSQRGSGNNHPGPLCLCKGHGLNRFHPCRPAGNMKNEEPLTQVRASVTHNTRDLPRGTYYLRFNHREGQQAITASYYGVSVLRPDSQCCMAAMQNKGHGITSIPAKAVFSPCLASHSL